MNFKFLELSPHKIALIFTGLFSFIILSCKDKKGQNPPVSSNVLICDSIKFSRHIYPIIAKNCAVTGCHIMGFPSGDFSTYNGLFPKITNGTFKIRVFDSPGNPMPPNQMGGQLPQFELDSIKCWLERGAINN